MYVIVLDTCSNQSIMVDPNIDLKPHFVQCEASSKQKTTSKYWLRTNSSSLDCILFSAIQVVSEKRLTKRRYDFKYRRGWLENVFSQYIIQNMIFFQLFFFLHVGHGIGYKLQSTYNCESKYRLSYVDKKTNTTNSKSIDFFHIFWGFLT